jgi:hypothetical protein
MHSVDFESIPFLDPEPDGAGRTVAESVFYNTRRTREENMDHFRKFFGDLGWKFGNPEEEFIGQKLFSVSLTFKYEDASIRISMRDWVDETTRVVVEGNGIQFPGDSYCQMLARSEALAIDP